MTSLGGFRLVHPVGRGVLGDTYLGVRPDGRPMAVKELHLAWGPPAETGRQVGTTVSHFTLLDKEGDARRARYVVPVDGGYDPAADRAWIATPWLSDSPGVEADRDLAVCLSTAVADQLLPAEAALYLLWQLAGLARYLHSRKLTLSGLKPSNVFLTTDRAVVVDVHMALTLRDLLHTGDSRSNAERRPFMWAEPDWLPPELRRARTRVHESSSVYAVGAITAYACTGSSLYPDFDLVHALMQPKASRKPAEEAIACWAAKHGNAGAKVRRAVLRSVRHSPWSRPGAMRLRRLAVSPLRGNHRLELYRTAWSHYVQSVLPREAKVREVPALNAGPRRREINTGSPSAANQDDGSSTDRPDPREALALGTYVRTPVTHEDRVTPGSTPHSPNGTLVTSDTPRALPGPVVEDAAGRDRPAHSPDDTGATSDSPARTRTGRSGTKRAWQLCWSHETGGPLLSPPLLVDEQLLVTYGSTAHLLDLDTGDHEHTHALGGAAESTPVMWGGRLWWALRDGTLIGYDAHDLTNEIRLELDGDPGRRSPVAVNDLLLIGTTHGLFRFQGSRSTVERRGQRLVRLEEPVVSPLATDGTRVWVPTERSGLIVVRPPEGEIHSPLQTWDSAGCTPMAWADGAYIGDAVGAVHQLTPAATPLRRWDVSTTPITAAPVLCGDLLLVTDHSGDVIALSKERSDQVWRTSTDGDGRSALTVSDGLVYVCGARSVWCLDAHTGQELRPLTPDGPRPVNVTAAHDRLHISHVDGRLNTWCPPT